MPRINTEATELSVAFGLLERIPESVSSEELPGLFEGSLSRNKFEAFVAEYNRQSGKYAAFRQVGERLKQLYPDLMRVPSVRWSGPEQQAATISVARDLVAASIPISVKDDSDVAHNFSPYNLFVGVPEGRPPATGETNWYVWADSEGIQALYGYIRSRSALDLPEEFRDFDATASRQQRDRLQDEISKLAAADRMQFNIIYVQMCRQVAQYSSNRFNQSLQASLQTSGRQSILENIVKGFFRVNAVPYLLAGIDRRKPFAVRIPDITEWKQRWRVLEVEAIPALDRRQSVVYLNVRVAEKSRGGLTHDLGFRVEIRWSHGKFCGNPEAKLYKQFGWTGVPFFEVLF